VCAHTPYDFRAVGLWYENFDQTSDDEVRETLARCARSAGTCGPIASR
jgi:predicted phosphoribosyltransferase